MNKIVLTAKEARRIVYGEHPDWRVEEERTVDTTRWSIHHEAIVLNKTNDKHYEFCYSTGATERQDESPYEYESEVEVYEVAPVEVKAIQWVRVQ